MIFHEPETVENAVALLGSSDDARCLAGGATLVAMMNAELVAPPILVSLRRIKALKRFERRDDGSVVIGAMTTHQSVASSALLTGGQQVVRHAARTIGHPAIRNMGTMGGSICHGDSAADYPAALVAADATIRIAGPGGLRDLRADGFFVDDLETDLDPGELVTEIHVPAGPAGAVGVYEKHARVDGDFATVSVAVVAALEGEICRYIALALGSCGPAPVRVAAAEQRLTGSTLSDPDILAACGALLEASDPLDDFRGSAEYRKQLIPVLVRRALKRAVVEGIS